MATHEMRASHTQGSARPTTGSVFREGAITRAPASHIRSPFLAPARSHTETAASLDIGQKSAGSRLVFLLCSVMARCPPENLVEYKIPRHAHANQVALAGLPDPLEACRGKASDGWQEVGGLGRVELRFVQVEPRHIRLVSELPSSDFL